jgi:membrane dipeptidase
VRVVAEMNRLGMMIDVSHVSARAFWAVIAITKAPIIASHSACAALTDSDRNLTDEQLRALAMNGGGGIPGFNNVTEAPNVTIELVRRGYTEDQVRKIWGGNLLRVWRAVAKAAASN